MDEQIASGLLDELTRIFSNVAAGGEATSFAELVEAASAFAFLTEGELPEGQAEDLQFAIDGAEAVSRAVRDSKAIAAATLAYIVGTYHGRLVQRICDIEHRMKQKLVRLKQQRAGMNRMASESPRVESDALRASIVWFEKFRKCGKVNMADDQTADQLGISSRTVAEWRKRRDWQHESS